MDRKPVAWIKNLSGPEFHASRKLHTPRGATVPIYDAADLRLFQGEMGQQYEVIPADGLKTGAPPVAPDEDGVQIEDASDGGSAPDGEKPDPFNHVVLHGADYAEPKEAKLQLADGQIVTIVDAIKRQVDAGHATFNGGWITLYPGTEFEVRAQGYGKLIEELLKDPGLFMPPEPGQ